MQKLLHLIYPPRCMGCDAPVASDFGLCATCWRDTPFIAGLVCDMCGAPLPGTEATDERILCDDCLRHPRPWARGRAATLYSGRGRDMVLAFKHGDRQDLARPAAGWLLRAAAPLLQPDMLVAPIPLHWLRMLRRRYNQAALLSRALAADAGLRHCPDLLSRRPTPSQEGRDRAARMANLDGAITLRPARAALVRDRPVLLVDDVMTSGATLGAAARACHAAGSGPVSVAVLARVAPDP